MTNIWVVQGSTGEYSDHCEWLVCAFYNEDAAKAFVEKLDALGRLAYEQRQKRNLYSKWRETAEGIELLTNDPDACIDYTGIRYTAFPVLIKDKPGETDIGKTVKYTDGEISREIE